MNESAALEEDFLDGEEEGQLLRGVAAAGDVGIEGAGDELFVVRQVREVEDVAEDVAEEAEAWGRAFR